MGQLSKEPVAGLSVNFNDEDYTTLSGTILGPQSTPYEGGLFKLTLTIPDRYPFEPPGLRFDTKIYHPNIDEGGRVCLDLLHCPPRGAWKPVLNIRTLLTSVRLLLSEPNPDDGLLADISQQYKFHREEFNAEARRFTKLHAMEQ